MSFKRSPSLLRLIGCAPDGDSRFTHAVGIILSLVFTMGGTGCGLVSSDIASLSFDLPPRQYVFDTAMWNLPSGNLPAVACTSGDMCCALALIGGYDCAKSPPLTCDTSTGAGVCALTLPVETPPQTIDLGMQVPQLSSLNGQTLANVSISQITYDVISTLNRQLPPVELFLAPQSAISTSDPLAHKFGTVPAIPANATVTGGTVALEPDAEATFSGYARNFKTPFKFLSRTVVTVRGGDETPSGHVDITVRGKVQAKPNL